MKREYLTFDHFNVARVLRLNEMVELLLLSFEYVCIAR